MRIGADYLGGGRCRFAVWAPNARKMEVKIIASTQEQILPMQRVARGYWQVTAEEISPGDTYFYRLNGEQECPDPASSFQPQGVHGPSQVIDHSAFDWTDGNWRGIPLGEMIIYEIHTGTFTPQGSFAAIIPRLKELKELGINAIELMPVAQFPGDRNWGYDGGHPFAVQNSYGGPENLKKLVDACHRNGIAIILDVVYNHLGPEGNYLGEFGPYFTDKYHTPWGDAVNLDDAGSDEVRHFFLENALHWFEHYHFDALRLDAIHAIYDFSAHPFLHQMQEKVTEFSSQRGRDFYLIAESDLNDVRVIRPQKQGGFGLQAHWNDDFHHALHTLLTGERHGYYCDFGKIEHLAKAYRQGFVYSWQYSAYRQRHHGSSSMDRPAEQFIVFAQNHDQVGNRLWGDRLASLTSLEGIKLAAGAVLFAPFVPLIFMGEEYGEDAPFLFFTDFSDPQLKKAVREGRKKEFQSFGWKGEPPDPLSKDTFERSRLCWDKRGSGRHRTVLEYYRQTIGLRLENPALARPDKKNLKVGLIEKVNLLWFCRWSEENRFLCLLNFNREPVTFSWPIEEKKRWYKRIDSAEPRWLGPGTLLPDIISETNEASMAPLSCALYQLEH